MWLGDIAKLPASEQYYLRSENVESDHSIGSEFYEGKIECIFTEPTEENRLFALRSQFVEACFKRFGDKVAHLDEEVIALALGFNAPLVDTLKERRHVADTLNRIYVESLDNFSLGKLFKKAGGDPKNSAASSACRGCSKRLRTELTLANCVAVLRSLRSPRRVFASDIQRPRRRNSKDNRGPARHRLCRRISRNLSPFVEGLGHLV